MNAGTTALQTPALPDLNGQGRGSGLFVSFEGIDGAGKSTHIAALAEALRASGKTVTLTREPGGTALAEKLRALLLAEPMDALTEALLVFAARRNHLQRVIVPALGRGEVLLCDRFTDATFAYQGAGRGFDTSVLAQLEQWVQSPAGLDAETISSPNPLIEPDLTLWFDLAPEVAASRLADARQPDRFETQPIAFFQRVANGYALRMHAAPQRFVRIDAGQEQSAVAKAVLEAFVQRGLL